ncbi:MAG TPA: MerR family transcriptional regulator [Anaerolineae bacterium]|nr:MerR family transcriptional regulator [Anaerolineae bacterium]
MKTTYAVRHLAILAGVSVRTLHHYDQIGLLKPTSRTAVGYRQYGEKDLLRLQQILFFKELDVPLSEIQAILDRPGFDQVKALKDHKGLLTQRADRLTRLLKTIDATIDKLSEAKMSLTDADLYEGFSQEQIDRYKREVRELYDVKIVEESEQRVGKMSKQQWAAIKAEGDAITRELAGLMDKPIANRLVQQAIGRHYAWVGNFYTVTPEIFRGLGQGYAEHPEFRATYDKYRTDMADFMQAAMTYYCDHTLAK